MDTDNDLRDIADRFETDAKDQNDNRTKPNLTDLAFVKTSMMASRNRATGSPMSSEDDERRAIIESIHNHIISETSDNTEQNKFLRDSWIREHTASTWAMLWVLPISDLSKLGEEMHKEPLIFFLFRFSQTTRQLDNLFGVFFTKSRTAGRAEKKRLPRDKSVATLAKKRDRHRCIVTSVVHPHACHIFPHASMNDSQTGSVLTALFKIWEVPHDLEEKLGSGEKSLVDTVQNIICLSRDLHDMWGRAYFAFFPEQPLQYHDGTWSIQLQFHWMRRLDFRPNENMGSGFFKKPEECKEKDNGNGVAAAVNLEKKTPIDDGKIIIIRANKKEELPDYDILLFQYRVIKMASLCGGAERTEDEEDDYDVRDAEYLLSSLGGALESP
ncbi:hypothetical protein ACHAQA_000290 [Verticillium albo-atrum]